MVWAAVSWARGVDVGGGKSGEKERQEELVMLVVKCSGTMRKCEQEAVRRAKQMCGRVKGLERIAEGGLGALAGGDVDGESDDLAMVDASESESESE